jgi:uncharacterized protein with PIN domain
MKTRFLVDGMLGSLSRWLRIGGYDAEYRRDRPDDELIDEAKREDRVLLTRDEVLVMRARKRGVKAIYVKGIVDEDGLNQLVGELKLTLDPKSSRCPKCNHIVSKTTKEDVKERVPIGTLKVVEEYWICPQCGGIYWRGSHWPKIVETLNNAARGSG